MSSVKTMPHSKVHPSEELISAKSMELGPCILITPRTLELGHQIQDKQLDDPDVMSMYSDIDKRELQEMTDNKEVAYENIKIQSPVHSEHKVDVNYEAPIDFPENVVASENAKVPEQAPQPSKHKLLSFISSVKPVVMPSPEEDDWRRK